MEVIQTLIFKMLLTSDKLNEQPDPGAISVQKSNFETNKKGYAH